MFADVIKSTYVLRYHSEVRQEAVKQALVRNRAPPIDAAGHATVPEGVTALEAYAFYECDSLVSITLPASLTSMGYEAFGGCSSLTTLTIVSDHAEPRVLTREQPFDTAAVQQALEQARAA